MAMVSCGKQVNANVATLQTHVNDSLSAEPREPIGSIANDVVKSDSIDHSANRWLTDYRYVDDHSNCYQEMIYAMLSQATHGSGHIQFLGISLKCDSNAFYKKIESHPCIDQKISDFYYYQRKYLYNNILFDIGACENRFHHIVCILCVTRSGDYSSFKRIVNSISQKISPPTWTPLNMPDDLNRSNSAIQLIEDSIKNEYYNFSPFRLVNWSHDFAIWELETGWISLYWRNWGGGLYIECWDKKNYKDIVRTFQ